MNTKLCLLLPVAAGTILAAGCAYTPRAEVRGPATITNPAGELIVAEPPPAPRAEVAGTAPDEHHIWVGGYWVHVNERWVWVPGQWDTPPRAGERWVPGHWTQKQNGHDWIWSPGYWE